MIHIDSTICPIDLTINIVVGVNSNLEPYTL